MNIKEQKAAAIRYFDAAEVLGLTEITPATVPAFLRYIGVECEPLDYPKAEAERPELELRTETAELPVGAMPVITATYNRHDGVDGIVRQLEDFCRSNNVDLCEVIYNPKDSEPIAATIQKRCSTRHRGFKMRGGKLVFSMTPFKAGTHGKTETKGETNAYANY